MKKNILILHTDQQRFDSLGCNGNPSAQTVNIDKLASEGCNFTRHISTNTACMPSRASLMTGLYVPGHGVSSNGIPLWRRDNGCEDKNNVISQRLFGVDVHDRIPTMGDVFTENGYDTYLLGKLHLEPLLADPSYEFYESSSIWEREETVNDTKPYYGFNNKKLALGHGEAPCNYNGGHYGRWLKDKHPKIFEQLATGGEPNTKEGSIRKDIKLSELPSELHNSTWLADETCNYLDNRKDNDKPFFMFVGFPDPHHPFVPPKDIAKDFLDIPLPDFAKKSDIKGKKPKAVEEAMESFHVDQVDLADAYRYTTASVKLIDNSVGVIIDKLKEMGVYDDTIIVYTSDHGDFLGDLEMICKYDVAFNNLLNVPFIVKPAKDFKKIPKVNKNAMSNADVLPTLMSMVGLDESSYMQGVDIFSKQGENNKPMVTCFTAREPDRNITLYDNQYRYTYYLDSGEEELYDHNIDKKELNNLAYEPTSEYKEICNNFKSELLQKHVESDLGIFNHYGLW